MELVVCINSGSSSVKVSVYGRAEGSPLLMEWALAGLTSDRRTVSYKVFADGAVVDKVKGCQVDCKDHDAAFQIFLDMATAGSDAHAPVIPDFKNVYAICHRIVHGGANPKPLKITTEVYNKLDELSDLAPLHNQRALDIVHSCIDRLGDAVTNVAFFDSSFHESIPRHIYTYPLDLKVQEHHKIRKFGFHGLSYSFITRSAATFLDKPVGDVNLVALHLGSGASACAIRHGRSLDTSMGLTPLEGLPGATRSGSIDPSLMFHYHSDASRMSAASSTDLKLSVAEDIMNRHAGWSALTGTTDFGDIEKRAAGGDELCALAFDLFVNRVCNYVGSYFVALRGDVDALVFAGGIGEKSARFRAEVTGRLGFLGVELNADTNGQAAQSDDVVVDVSAATARVKTLVVQTDEQLEMALEAHQLNL
ncbi:Acetokinase family-domain-containing protein [Dipodascopsis tothii]|uniref:Acetokinase family-domain-containing protein n=1 Tax=Dipodascopsis tothii TaxID=44089 RepID=UPI0034CD7124